MINHMKRAGDKFEYRGITETAGHYVPVYGCRFFYEKKELYPKRNKKGSDRIDSGYHSPLQYYNLILHRVRQQHIS